MNKPLDQDILLRTAGVSMYYPQIKTYALRELDFSAGKGEFVGIKGPSGSGKSTLLYLLAGLVEPTAGQVYFQGKPLKRIRNKSLYRRKNIGFVFQDFYLYPRFTVLENVLFPCLHQLWVPRATIKKAEALLESMHIGRKKNVSVEVLSAGERQRVCIARALLYEPQCILADEPTGNLDSQNARVILGLLEAVNKEKGTTILMVTHDEKVSEYAHRLVHMIDGHLVKK